MSIKSTGSDRQRVSRWPGAAAVGLAISVLSSSAAAQSNPSPRPPRYVATEVRVQPPKPVFNFQARISQAKIPLGTAEFPTIRVDVLSGATADAECSETFRNVKVAGGVLNLRIGERMSCDLADMMARTADLKIKICLNENNCLKDVPLSTVPYAVKSTYAMAAQQAAVANRASESEITHFASADQDVYTADHLARGYYDFHSPTNAAAVAELMNAAGFGGQSVIDAAVDDGYLRWTPVYGRGQNKLHIVSSDGNVLRELTDLFLHAGETHVAGHATVSEGLTVKGDSTIESANGSSTFALGASLAEMRAGDNGVVTTNTGTALNGAVRFDENAQIDFAGAEIINFRTPETFTISPESLTGDLPASRVSGVVSDAQSLSIPASKITGSFSDLTYSGTQSRLSVAEQQSAVIRVRDLLLGHSSMRGQPGRAMVDYTDALVLNYAGDWKRVEVQSDLRVTGAVDTGGVGAVDISPRGGSQGECVGGGFSTQTNNSGQIIKMCIDPDEIQTSRTLSINNEAGAPRTEFGQIGTSGVDVRGQVTAQNVSVTGSATVTGAVTAVGSDVVPNNGPNGECTGGAFSTTVGSGSSIHKMCIDANEIHTRHTLYINDAPGAPATSFGTVGVANLSVSGELTVPNGSITGPKLELTWRSFAVTNNASQSGRTIRIRNAAICLISWTNGGQCSAFTNQGNWTLGNANASSSCLFYCTGLNPVAE
jgi:hypothetical protein